MKPEKKELTEYLKKHIGHIVREKLGLGIFRVKIEAHKSNKDPSFNRRQLFDYDTMETLDFNIENSVGLMGEFLYQEQLAQFYQKKADEALARLAELNKTMRKG